ncbi:hypothetical protein R5W23_003870 [Gemmata sp. JC673]|uniref:Uncharacterized protein n=1 Tax=Gemmata algarum TaxID=2975278 RepID=A0ABU5F4J8_9BACT|nr:hypothetical protein [Gemmata algarum]MDY3562404.1 hypothetical protein [Gemmata algarum]
MMTPAAPPAGPAPAEPFRSADAVRAAHAALLAELPDPPRPGDLARVTEFIRRAVATGAVLDAPDDRKLVQGLIDYWAAALVAEYREATRDGESTRVKPPSTVLTPFAPATLAAAVAAADRWLAAAPPEDQQLARRVLLRLVRLRNDDTFAPAPTVRAGLSGDAPPEDLLRVLRELAGAGVIRVTPGDVEEMDRVALRSPALLDVWPIFNELRKERTAFRQRVTEWERTGRISVGDGLTDAELDQARAYHDRNAQEREFIEACRARTRRRQELFRGGLSLLAVLLLLVIPLAVYSWLGWVTADRETVRAEGARENAEYERKNAESEKAKAEAAEAEVSRQHRLVRTVQAVRTMAEIGAARGEADLDVALNRWHVLADGILADERQQSPERRFFTPRGQKLHLLRGTADLTGMADEARKKALAAEQTAGRDVAPQQLYATDEWQQFGKGTALTTAHVLRDALLEGDDPKVQTALKAVRTDAYLRVRLCVNGVLKVVDSKTARPFDDVEPYVREFWLNYWGDMGLVESGAVAGAMGQFGSKLGQIESTLPQYAFQDRLTRYNENTKAWGKQVEGVRRAAELLSADPAKRNEANRWCRNYSRMLYRSEAEELRKLADKLLAALAHDEKESIRPYGSN